MLSAWYGFWDYWVLNHKVTFDGANKLIYVNANEYTIDVKIDIYSSWKEWIQVEDNSKYLQAIRAIGGDPTSGGQQAGDIYFLMNNWRVVIPHSVNLTGVLYHDDPVDPFIILPGGGVKSTVSNLVQTVVKEVAAVNTPAQIASAVRVELTPELNKINSQVDGLTPTQAIMLQEIYALYGLDPTKPLVVTDTARDAGTIHQNISTTQNQTTVQRV